jgi:hypothetical protein
MSIMSEPSRELLRPIPMMRTLLPLAALLLVAGCGSAESSSADKPEAERTETSTSMVGQCPTDAPAVTSARTVASADLDGDGKDDVVKLTAADGDCANLLFAKVGERYVTTRVPVGEPVLAKAFAVDVPGHEGALLVTRQVHPRGGFQLRVYAAGKDDLVELKVDGHSLVPFVALDVQEHPLSIDCTDGGVVVTEAVAHEPHGVAFAWDIKRTSYTVDGTGVTAGETEEVADNVLPAQLEAKYPDLVKHTAFESCRA